MANHIEEAKSGRASCRTCKKTIAKGELRLGVETPNQFGDTPSMQWHHLACAAGKLPAELKEAMAAFAGDIPAKAELEKAMADAYAKGNAKPGGFPYVDRAPTGRAKCMECGEAIAKDSFRVAVEREIEVGASTQRGAGYLHPKCVGANLENVGGDKAEVVEGLRKNSRLPAPDLEGVLLEVNDN
jgi:poly [ADP-ribose] polymerase